MDEFMDRMTVVERRIREVTVKTAADRRVRKIGTALIVFYFTGVVMYTVGVERFSLIKALYFCTVTLTTIGFGRITPTNGWSRVFTAAYVLCSLGIIAVSISEITNYVADKRLKRTRRALAGMVSDATAEISGSSSPLTPIQRYRSERRKALVAAAIMSVYILFFSTMFYILERSSGWTYGECIYFTIIAGSTVGYGDVTPTTRSGRIICIIFLPITVVTFGTQMTRISKYILGSSADQKLAELHANLSLENLLAMDTDGDGSITELEFIQFMLTNSGMVPDTTFRDIKLQFRRLDSTHKGYLGRDTLLRLSTALLDGQTNPIVPFDIETPGLDRTKL